MLAAPLGKILVVGTLHLLELVLVDALCAMDSNDRVPLAGYVVDYLVGEINF